MFIVLNKDKMIAYGISVLTVIMLFGLANISLIKQDTIETSSNIKITFSFGSCRRDSI